MHTNCTTVVVFSHLRWDFVYQRPQQIMSRMARSRRVVFLEEPVFIEGGKPRWELAIPQRDVLVCRPLMPVEGAFSDVQMPLLTSMLGELASAIKLQDDCIVWLYTPMALPLARTLEPRLVVYDCMDELSNFQSAPPKLAEREEGLMRWADLVFTGGRSLYRGKRGRHPNVYCFPSSVDAAHFRRALTAVEPTDQAAIPRPRLGYYGVIDERLDYDLLDALAKATPAAYPEWQIVMVGPFAKVDPERLPRHANLHFLGQRSYGDLPAYLGGWDVCLMPFARNESTRFISPTKTLEYMAAEKPVVSTPIPDVAEPYGHLVYLSDTPEGFIAACERALSESEPERQARVANMREAVARTSWDATVHAMEELLDEESSRKRSQES